MEHPKEAETMHPAPIAVVCNCGPAVNAQGRALRRTAAAGLFAALGVCGACCLLPFIFLSVGIGGAWIGAIDALAPYKWIFITATASFIGYGFYLVYWKSIPACPAGAACKACKSGRPARLGLWLATILAISGIAFEYLEPLLLD